MGDGQTTAQTPPRRGYENGWKKKLRFWAEIAGAVILLAGVAINIWQYHNSEMVRKDAAAKTTSDTEHGAIIEAVKAETEARKDGDGELRQAIKDLGDVVTAHDKQTSGQVSELIAEMRISLHKLGLDGE